MNTALQNAVLIFEAANSMRAAVDGIERTDDNAALLDAASSRGREFVALATMANGDTWPFRKELRLLTQELNEAVVTIEKRLGAEITVDDKEEVHDKIAIREDGLFRLDAARINSLLALVHLSAALDASTTPSPKLKAV